MKVMTVVGTRPEVIRLSETIKQLESDFSHILVHTGQNYSFELNDLFFQNLSLSKPNYYLSSAAENATLTIAKILEQLDPILRKEEPDAFLILGDTNSCLSALVAKKLKIPIFHLEAGNRCFDERVPEEINRRIVDHISDINLTYSEISRQYLISEGIKPELVIKVGTPMREVLNANMEKISSSTILQMLDLKQNAFILASFHREENVDCESNLNSILNTLNKLVSKYNCPLLVSTHPRTSNRIQKLNLKMDSRILFHEPFSYTDYVWLQLNALVVISDSGTITEESSILNFNAVNLRRTHERPEGMQETSVILAGLSEESILDSVRLSIKHKNEGRVMHQITDYEPDKVSVKISRIIQSYTGYVNEYIWKK